MGIVVRRWSRAAGRGGGAHLAWGGRRESNLRRWTIVPVGDSDASVGRWRLQVIGLRRPRTTCSPSSPRIFVRWRVAIELPVFQGRVQPLHVVYLPDQIIVPARCTMCKWGTAAWVCGASLAAHCFSAGILDALSCSSRPFGGCCRRHLTPLSVPSVPGGVGSWAIRPHRLHQAGKRAMSC